MLTRLQVRGFKSLLDVDVRLAPLVVVLGPNAVGKSNLLEAMHLLSNLVTKHTLGDAFAPPLRGYPVEAFSLPEGGLPELLSKGSAQFSMQADILTMAPPGRKGEALRYRVSVRIRPKTGALEVVDEYLARLKKDGSPKHVPRIERVEGSKSDETHPHLAVRRLGDPGRPRKEPLGLNHTLASNLQFNGDRRYPDFDRLREELISWRTYYLDPRVAMREPNPPKEVDDIGSRGELIAPFLNRLKKSDRHARSFHAVRRALHSAIPTVEGLDVELDEKRGTLDIVIHQDGTPFSSRVISEGTLRVLALCALAANPWPGSLVAFEEPENGVHPRRAQVIADLLVSMVSSKRRQVVVTTHSPILIAAMAQRQREHSMGQDILLLRCIQEGSATRIEAFDPGKPLFSDQQISEALRGPDDERLLEEALLRGWLDG